MMLIRDATKIIGATRRIVVERCVCLRRSGGARQEVARSRQEAHELLAQTQLGVAQALRGAAEGAERQLNYVRRLSFSSRRFHSDRSFHIVTMPGTRCCGSCIQASFDLANTQAANRRQQLQLRRTWAVFPLFPVIDGLA